MGRFTNQRLPSPTSDCRSAIDWQIRPRSKRSQCCYACYALKPEVE